MNIQKVELAEADTLLVFSKKTFIDFFGHLNSQANMDAYTTVAFTSQRVHAELTNPNSLFYFAMLEDQPVGYLKLNFNEAQSDFQDKNAMEIERIYVLGEHHGKQIGKKLLNFAIDMATERQLNYVWLGVWEHNDNALGFYKHNGFEVFSSHQFMLGDDRQNDLLMKKMLR